MAEGEAPDLQFTPDGVNVAVKQDGALDVQPTISVSTTSDASNQEPVEISEITGQFEKVQVGDGSNVIYRKASNKDEDVPLSSVRPQTSVTTKENLHFVIDSPQGIIQIGKCCILLRVNFSNSLVSQLLEEGDVSVNLKSSDTLLELHWSNWEEKKECIRSKIKIEIQTSLEQSRDSFEHDVISQLLNNSNNYMQLRTLVNLLYDMFGAMLHRITGGCIELWILHDRKEQLDEMKRRKLEVENMLTLCLCKEARNDFTCGIKFQDDVSNSQCPTLGLTTRHGSETLEQPVPSAEDASIRKGREKIKRKSEDLVSREEMQTYVKRAIDESMITHTKTDPISKVEQEGGLMIIGREGIREIMSHQEEGIRMYEGMLYRKPINIVRKEELRALIWERLHESREVNIDRKVKAKGKTVSPQVRNLITSLYNLVLYDVERRLPEELYMDIGHFRSGLYDHVLELNRSLLLELERLSAFDKDHLSETEANELKVRNQTEIEMCARAIALYARQVVSLPQSRQTTERLIKEPEETGTHIPEKKEDTVRPVDTETLRLRKERLLQQATTPQKDFLKQELDFYEINEKTDSELPLGTRVEPKSKRALLQASLRRPGAEAAARLEAAEETFGTVVSHVAEDEEQVIVHWDNPDESFLYHESNVQAIMRQVPRKIMREQQVGIGVFVEKSATWTFEDQAGPVGVGTVIRHDLETGLVQVKWHGGVPGWNSYRTAEDVETRTECFIDGEE